MREKQSTLIRLFKWDKLVFLLAFLIPIVFYTEHAGKLILIALICVISKSNLVNSTMKIEVHSFLIAVTANLYGAGAGIFIAFVANALELKVGPLMKVHPNPMFLVTDFFYMVVLSIVSAAVPARSLMLAAMLTIILVDHILVNVLRFATLPDKPKHWINSAINTIVTYLLFAKLLGATIAFLA